MIRTQVSLDEREYELAKREAKALGVSVAEFCGGRSARLCRPPVKDPG